MDPRHFESAQLEILKTVAEAGSMAEAGRRLFMTGPAVDQQVQQLERTLGMPAFDRPRSAPAADGGGERALAAANECTRGSGRWPRN